MKIANQLDELLQAGIISDETAEAIKLYYYRKNQHQSNSSRLITAFAILGASLVGLGIILIIAHNWDSLNRTIKTIFAFVPLVIGHGVGLHVLLRKNDSIAWREGVSVFIFFAVAASIAMVSQIYNIPGDMADFLLTWMLLCLPLFYLMHSSITALLYLTGITAYAVAEGYFKTGTDAVWPYWGLLTALIPYYFFLIKRSPAGNFASFFNWIIPISIVICLGLFSHRREELMVPAYLLLLTIFYLIGKTSYFNSIKLVSNGYQVIGLLGSLSMLLYLTFDEFWQAWHDLSIAELLFVSEFWVVAVFILVAIFLLYEQKWLFSPIHWLVFFIGLIFSIGLINEFLPWLLVNLFYLFSGIWYIRRGASVNHLVLLNFGLLIIASLVVARFFDANLSFVIRGFLFLLVGTGFFVANYLQLKKRKEQKI